MASRGSAVAFGVMRQRWGGRSRVSELVLIERKRGADGTPEASPWGTRRVIAGMLTGAVVLGFAAWPRMAPAATPDSFADLADQLLPAVVNIATTQTLKQADKGDRGGQQQRRGPDIPQCPPGSPFAGCSRTSF